MRIRAWLLLALCLAAEHAVAGGRWEKGGATQEEITRDDVACFKESQRLLDLSASEGKEHRTGQLGMQPRASTAVREKSSNGSPEIQTEPDVNLYRACAFARGYIWVKS